MNGLLSLVPTNNDCDFTRIANKQDQMFHRTATLCPERAEIITESFKRSEGKSIVIRRAQALADNTEKKLGRPSCQVSV